MKKKDVTYLVKIMHFNDIDIYLMAKSFLFYFYLVFMHVDHKCTLNKYTQTRTFIVNDNESNVLPNFNNLFNTKYHIQIQYMIICLKQCKQINLNK